jgi:hypothetical protein
MIPAAKNANAQVSNLKGAINGSKAETLEVVR